MGRWSLKLTEILLKFKHLKSKIMRTIKFRGKNINEWVYGDLVQCDDIKIVNSNRPESLSYRITSDTVGQFTGLLDANGKEIYEGDIVKYLSYAREEVGYIGFHARSASFRVIAEHTDYGIGNRGELHELELEVIGNIYDNPELVKWSRL